MESGAARKAGADVKLRARHTARLFCTLASLGLDKKARMDSLFDTLLLSKNTYNPVLNNRSCKTPSPLQRVPSMPAVDLAPPTGPLQIQNHLVSRTYELFAHAPCHTSTPSAQGHPFQMTWHDDLSACLARHAGAGLGRTWPKYPRHPCIRSATTCILSRYSILCADHGYPSRLFGALEPRLENTCARRLGPSLWDSWARGWCCGRHLPHRCPPRGRGAPGMARRPRAAKICAATHRPGAGADTRTTGGGHGA